MRRSLLFMPANSPSMLQNSSVFDCDSVIYDLEDAVSVQNKDSARILLDSFLNNNAVMDTCDMEVVVRINGMDTDYYMDDLMAIVSDKIDAIMLPKARTSDLIKLDEILTKLEKERKMTKKIVVLPIIELAISLIEVDEIAACPRVNGILLGAEDFTSDMEVERTKVGNEIFYARCKVATACHAYGIDAIDTPFTDVNDNEGLIKDTNFAKSIGMTSKAAIHPNQIEAINSIFVPSKKMIDWAVRVDYASKQNTSGVFSLDGKMVDKPVMDRARKILAKASRYGLL